MRVGRNAGSADCNGEIRHEVAGVRLNKRNADVGTVTVIPGMTIVVMHDKVMWFIIVKERGQGSLSPLKGNVIVAMLLPPFLFAPEVALDAGAWTSRKCVKYS